MEKGIEQLFIERMSELDLSFSEMWQKLKKLSDGLMPVIAQDFNTCEVLMMAYMDEEAFIKTLQTGFMHYHSRSRNVLWFKGETSGHVQRIIEGKIDCDNDTLLFLIEQTGAACHTGKKSCFYRTFADKIEKDCRKRN